MLTRTLAILLLAATPALAIQGQATVIDGDTIEIHGERIRLHGIDAPEARQVCYLPGSTGADAYRCGQEAAFALADHIGRRTVTCQQTDIDRYKRVIARCSVGGQDVALWLVENGHALDWPRYSRGEYADAQRRAAGKGVWRGQFQWPWEWRRDRNSPLVN